jgi:hypothetical protein
MYGEGVVMQSPLSHPGVLPHSRKLTAIGTFLDQLGTCVLLLILAAGGIIVVVWLIE